MNRSTPNLWTLKSVTLRGSTRNRLDAISLAIVPGVTAILGESGAGKSSLLGLLVGLDRPDAGSVECHIKPLAGQLAVYWVPPGEGLWSPLTVREHMEIVAPKRDKLQSRVEPLLAAFDLTGLEKSRPDDLSQGERARLAMARALASEAQVLILDEPLVHTSITRNEAYWGFVRETCRQLGISLVLATHDLSAVRREADRILILDAGRVVFAGDWRENGVETPFGHVGAMLEQIRKAM